MAGTRRGFERIMIALSLAAAGASGLSSPAMAQAGGRTAAPKAGATKGAPQAKPEAGPAPQLKVARHLVSPNDPIAVVNGEPITRQQLADECVARRGEEILETMITRKLIDQVVRARGVTVTPAEIDAEVERVARAMAGVDAQTWLRSLAKERNISPSQYTRDIIQPSIALRKLAEPQVQVTDQDMKEAYEQQFGEQLTCRMIMLPTQAVAIQVWEELKKNPEAFEKLAQERSIDQATRSVGGMMPMPITRHASPVADRAFKDLVDDVPGADPKDPAYESMKPKDGTVSGVIQVGEAAWVIFRREALAPAQQYDKADKVLAGRMAEAVKDRKVQAKIGEIVEEMMRTAKVENRLTGTTNVVQAGEETEAPRVDGQVKLMSDPNSALPKRDNAGASPTAGRAKVGVPAGVSAEDVKKTQDLKRGGK